MSGLQAASTCCCCCWRCSLRWEGEQERRAQPASKEVPCVKKLASNRSWIFLHKQQVVSEPEWSLIRSWDRYFPPDCGHCREAASWQTQQRCSPLSQSSSKLPETPSTSSTSSPPTAAIGILVNLSSSSYNASDSTRTHSRSPQKYWAVWKINIKIYINLSELLVSNASAKLFKLVISRVHMFSFWAFCCRTFPVHFAAAAAAAGDPS